MLLNIMHPVPDVLERPFVGDVVHQEDPLGASIIGCAKDAKTSRHASRIHRCDHLCSGDGANRADRMEPPAHQKSAGGDNARQAPSMLTAGDRPEALVTRGVPHLQLHPLVVQVYALDFEVDPADAVHARAA